MKKYKYIRKRILKQMAFSVFIVAVLPLSSRTAGDSSAADTKSFADLNRFASDAHRAQGHCVLSCPPNLKQ
ncbi:MAG: hypothetical protein AAGN35_02535 [Bacteroidota bacterium]